MRCAERGALALVRWWDGGGVMVVLSWDFQDLWVFNGKMFVTGKSIPLQTKNRESILQMVLEA